MFPLAEIVAGHEENLPSSCPGRKVAALPVWECKMHVLLLGSVTEPLFLLGSVIDVFLFGVLDIK